MATQSSTASQFLAAGGLGVGPETSPTVVADASGNLYQEGVEMTATAAELNMLHQGAGVVSGRRLPEVVVIPLLGTAATTGGAVGAESNVIGGSLFAVLAWMNITTASTGAASLSVGVAANTTTSASNLFSAQDVHTAPGVFISSIVGLTETASEAITVTGSASTAGLVGTLYVLYWPI
jgi:hypothetical protein